MIMVDSIIGADAPKFSSVAAAQQSHASTPPNGSTWTSPTALGKPTVGPADTAWEFFETHHASIRTAGLVLAALFALTFAWWRARTADKQARIAEQGCLTERLSIAVEHLESAEPAIRLGGINALWRLTHGSSQADLTYIIDILCAFVRDPTHLPLNTPMDSPVRRDVQAVVTLLGDEKADYRKRLPTGNCLDLTRARLCNCDFTGTNLTGANFMYSWFRDADFTDATIPGTNFHHANITVGTNFTGANLTGADFTGADTSTGHLKFNDANLKRAVLKNLNLTESDFQDANLKDVDFENSNLSITNFKGAVGLAKNSLTTAYYCQETGKPGYDSYRGPPKNLPEGIDLPVVRDD